MKKAVVLLSGGLDSATTLYYAKAKGFAPQCLTFDYGQRHGKEIVSARRLARRAGCPSQVVTIRLPWQGSSLLDKNAPLPRRRTFKPGAIPSTYVPGRNIIFLSFAASFAEAAGARAIFIGANAVDYSGYPDCRPEFFAAFQKALARGLKAGVEKRPVKIYAPLLKKTKAQIIRLGVRLGVPYNLTWSCYRGGARPCGVCESCFLRRRGFEEAGIMDPLMTKSQIPNHKQITK
jgi:7-cyano-7-deazaguanine synthase